MHTDIYSGEQALYYQKVLGLISSVPYPCIHMCATVLTTSNELSPAPHLPQAEPVQCPPCLPNVLGTAVGILPWTHSSMSGSILCPELKPGLSGQSYQCLTMGQDPSPWWCSPKFRGCLTTWVHCCVLMLVPGSPGLFCRTQSSGSSCPVSGVSSAIFSAFGSKTTFPFRAVSNQESEWVKRLPISKSGLLPL